MGDVRLWRGFLDLEDRLARHGVPRSSPAWLAEVERFYLHPTALRWVACVGRGGGKNLVGLKCDLTELIYGDFTIPAGERHFHVHTSENRTEAEKTLAQAAQYLRFLGVKHGSTADTINFDGSLAARGLKVLAKRIGANSGFRSTGGTTQESAKWNDEGTNPAEEVVTSWAAQMITHASARQRHFSTPMARDGFFFDLLSQGDTADQIVTQGPTWLFNPSVSEELCRSRSTSERVFRREYGAEPQAGALSAFDADAIDRAFAHSMPAGAEGPRHIVIDPSSGKKDSFTFASIGRVVPPPNEAPPYLRVYEIDGVEGSFWSRMTGDKLATTIHAFAEKHGAKKVHADQRESLMLSAAIGGAGLSYVVHTWTAQSKPTAVEHVRRWFADSAIALPPHKRLRSELLAFEEKIAPSGQFTFGARGSGHDDYVALLITAAMADLGGELRTAALDLARALRVNNRISAGRWDGIGRGIL